MTDDGLAGLDAETLARRIELLLDVVLVENGRRATYSEIAASLQERGLQLSQARWSYMTAGSRLVTDRALLTAIAEFFEVSPSYLLEPLGDLPERIEAQLTLLQTVRENRVRTFAARQLGELDPERLRELNRIITPPQKRPE